MDFYQNNDVITTKKSNKVSQDKIFSKKRTFLKTGFSSFTVCWREQKWRHTYFRKTIIGKHDVLVAEYQD